MEHIHTLRAQNVELSMSDLAVHRVPLSFKELLTQQMRITEIIIEKLNIGEQNI